MTAEELEQEFAPRGLKRGNLLLFAPDDAAALIRRARTEGVRVLGIEGFRVGGTETVPETDHLADYSTGAAATEDCWAAAERFLDARRGSGLAFEVILQ